MRNDNTEQRHKCWLRIKNMRIIGVCLILALSSCVWNDPVCHIPEANLHIKLSGCRIYFSRTDTFGTDYIDFNSTQVTFPDIYYVEPDTIYFVDRDGYYLQDFKSKQFNIKYINHIYPPDLTLEADSATFYGFLSELERIAREDSILRAKPHYSIGFHDNATGLSVFNPKRELIFNQSAVTFFYEYFISE